MIETGNVVVSWILQCREMVTTLAICYLLWFLMAKHIPFLAARDDERAAREGNRSDAAMTKITQVVEGLDTTMHGVLSKLEEISLRRRP